jgi:2-polyprenyl-6-hydroxyphenyl methylase/3-demethylubiquinone-9 3-methyltransferase
LTEPAPKKAQKDLGGDDFDSFAADWWNPKGSLKSLHEITPLRFEYFKEKAELVMGDLKEKRVLDVGCGGGLLAEKFALEGAQVTGIDLSGKAIEVAKAHAKETGKGCEDIDYRRSSIGDFLKKEKKPFDLVVCSEVLEHVDDLKAFLAEASKALAPGGPFFFSTINKTLKARIFAIFVAENLLGLLPTGTHDYDKFIRPSTLVKLFKENDITVEDLKGLVYSPTALAFKVSGDVSVNYMGYALKA